MSQVKHNKNELIILNKFRKRLEREKAICNYASNYYNRLHLWYVVPGIIITGISSISSFLATNNNFSDSVKSGLIISVGILTSCSSVLQAVGSSFEYGIRKDSFQKAADNYDNLITMLEFEICNPNEEFILFCNNLEESILKIKQDCVYLPPLSVIAKYDTELVNKHITTDSPSHTTLDDVILNIDDMHTTQTNA